MVKRKACSDSDSDASYRPPGKRARASSKAKANPRNKSKAARPKRNLKSQQAEEVSGGAPTSSLVSAISNGAAGIMHPSNGPEGVRARLQKMIDKGGELGKGAKKRLADWEEIQAAPYGESLDGECEKAGHTPKKQKIENETWEDHSSGTSSSESPKSEREEEEVTKPKPQSWARLMPIAPGPTKHVETNEENLDDTVGGEEGEEADDESGFDGDEED